jgi:leucyl/phenylalanyl-tRNA---protein transferase
MRRAAVAGTYSMHDPWADVELPLGGGVPVAIGGQLTPEAILGGCLRGIFCTPSSDPGQIALNEKTYGPDVRAKDIGVLPGSAAPYATIWWSPKERYVIPVGQVRLGRSLRRTLRSGELTTATDEDFDGVIAGVPGSNRRPCRTGDREQR